MNITNMKKLINYLEAPNLDVGFNMKYYIKSRDDNLLWTKAEMMNVLQNGCGTTACIAGHAAILAWGEGDAYDNKRVSLVAREWLGLGEREARHLFLGLWSPLDLWSNEQRIWSNEQRIDERITLEDAIQQLRVMVREAELRRV